MYKISIIIPIYNVEKYFKDCMDSILNQTIGFENLQIIMVDDCSTDNSYIMAQEYAKKYPNCICKQLEKNSGVAGKARNEGLKYVEGKYIMFTDPDDFYAPNSCEIMYKNMEEKNADFIVANWQYTDEDGTPWNRVVFDLEKYKPFKLSIDDFKDSFFVMNSSVCNKVFNAEFVKKNNIKFLEGVPAEDAFFTMSSFVAAKDVYYIDDVMYYYRQRNKTGLSVSFACSKDYFGKINRAYRAIYEMFVENKRIKFYRFLYARNMTYMLYRFIDSTILSDEDRIEILAEMRWFYKLSVTLNVPACQKSLATLINKIIDGEYRDVIDMCKIIAEVRTYMPKEIRESMSKPYEEMYNEMMKVEYVEDEEIEETAKVGKIAFYFKEINRAGSELALLRYFQKCKDNKDKVLIYENDDTSDKSVLDEFSKCVEVHHLLKGEQYEAKCAVNCSIYDVFEEIFDNVKAERYIFWAQVNPFYNGRYEDKTRLLKYDAFLVPSKYIQKILVDNLPEIKDKIVVANPVVDIDSIRKMADEKQDAIKKGKKKNILTVARFSESKGLDVVLKVAKELKNMNLDFNWDIMGLVADSKKDFYEKVMNEGKSYGLNYYGVAENPYKYMKNSDLTAIFSKDEAWGTVVTESKAVGVPVVISKIGGMTEQVQDGIDGLVYDLPKNDDDVKSIAKGMYELLTNDKKYEEMKSNLKNFEYNTNDIIDTMNQCFYNK